MIKKGLVFYTLNNMSFSQRKGLKPIRKEMQIDSMDQDLLNALWNAWYLNYYASIEGMRSDETLHNLRTLVGRLWSNYFKLPLDEIGGAVPDYGRGFMHIRDYFYKCAWNEVYDFIEFTANSYPDNEVNSKFMKDCNKVLEHEFSTYRFIGGKITEITSEEEISEIEEALKTPLAPVREHLKTALNMLSDKKKPDYRNSIKESISAVEAICKQITGDPKATLGRVIGKLERNLKLHPDLIESFKKLYGYTSDADGIRHALMEEQNLEFEDAKFMLVSCSAFVNYLISKASKAGIKF